MIKFVYQVYPMLKATTLGCALTIA
ncbi:hypothetical protein MTR67_047450 [Solanum verrucosum]|uniref:Uncharacterized protein n=1 Tax=Solanum verrucosum TaxID=315347 RepID=A0AAF0ZYM1_SOLVR|nr:hypothetical protein MTR67_047450 [Solanum verrucosum]